MELRSHSYRFIWQGIEIEATYTPRCYGGAVAHLAVRSITPEGAPLPITETGYRSHFHQPGTIEAHGGNVIGQVMAWLDEEAAKPAWRAHVDDSRQLRLF